MVRNIVVLGGSSHPELVEQMCIKLGIPPGRITLSKFSVGETRVEIQDSVRGKDVYVIQSGCGKVNDNFIELLITISACKTASAKRVTAVMPLFPYSRQPDIPYNKVGAPLAKAGIQKDSYTFESRPGTPAPQPDGAGSSGPPAGQLEHKLSRLSLDKERGPVTAPGSPSLTSRPSFLRRQHTGSEIVGSTKRDSQKVVYANGTSGDWDQHRQPGYKQWVAQAGTLIADLLTCAGADHIITMDLHDPQYQGFFDIPVDNLYGRPLLQRYIQTKIPDYQSAVIVSPDAGGAKRATAIADALGMDFALIHKERRPTKITDRQNATMMLVGDISGRVAILVDDLADTSNTITRAAKLLKERGGATKVYALLTHGIFSGDAIARINASAIDQVVVTNSVPQNENTRACPKLKVLDVSSVFSEAIRRVHHGESISVLFKYD
ncbi:ribose-phosphate pyrophosphokinase [Orbilia oligospora]|uniref:Ribose-phosphate pyrophosphokinase n=1 Tax=Orbilia oligospora TaxID=2813651 RepID=A0A7C8JC83_ORBOL|nr:ribose-phosphate pyrophosphokinase [Orbilia oligospora]KAF3089504.1 ribose-phosphate pyrophosphokinase [Orbilia oligospora]KAF3089505.1 ribose-phosphate pyrophosphokinase, variant 2 [Orbilia oligospora]KAF3110448.1 ribose-phosphate pyrophosphokinase [Orbilia oligospora]KAF3119444.1 ribose-phosphate pyrophosphokinase [Orbilia oligospora]